MGGFFLQESSEKPLKNHTIRPTTGCRISPHGEIYFTPIGAFSYMNLGFLHQESWVFTSGIIAFVHRNPVFFFTGILRFALRVPWFWRQGPWVLATGAMASVHRDPGFHSRGPEVWPQGSWVLVTGALILGGRCLLGLRSQRSCALIIGVQEIGRGGPSPAIFRALPYCGKGLGSVKYTHPRLAVLQVADFALRFLRFL